MLRPVSRWLQVRRGGLSGQNYKLAAPPRGSGDLPCPIKLAERFLLANVEDPADRAIGFSRQNNGISHILDIASRCAPGGHIVGVDDGGTPIIHAFENVIEA